MFWTAVHSHALKTWFKLLKGRVVLYRNDLNGKKISLS